MSKTAREYAEMAFDKLQQVKLGDGHAMKEILEIAFDEAMRAAQESSQDEQKGS